MKIWRATFCGAAALFLWPVSGDGQTQVDLRSQTKSVDFSAASSTKPSKAGTTLPVHCGVGEFYFKTNAASGQNIFGCTATDVWAVQSAATGLPAPAGNTDKVLSNDGTQAGWRAIGGDVSGAPQTLVVGGLRGRSLSASAPVDGQVLRYNGTTLVWEPGTLAGAPAPLPNYSKPFTAALTVTIAGVEHGLGTASLVVSCYDGATPAAWIEPDLITVHPTTFDVTVTFAQPQTGRCVINGTGAGGGSGGGGAIFNVFGRVGGILAQTGDYSFAQVSGTVPDLQIAAGVNAAKIGTGTVSNTTFAALANVTGDVQSQLNGKAATIHSHTGGGDLAGDITNATVTRLQNFTVASTAPGDGQALVWSQASARWQPQAIGSGGGGGGGASMAAQLGDFQVVWTSGVVLTVGSNCSSATPCNFRFGNTVYQVTGGATATLSAATPGIAYFYLTSDGILNVGHNLAVTCSAGCVSSAGVSGFPANTIPLFAWTALHGTWDANGGRDYRAHFAAKSVIGGTGIAAIENGTQTTLGVDTAVIPTYLTAVANITFSAIANGACSTELPVAVAGASPGDSVAPGWPVALPSGLLGMMRVTGANSVGVRLCNLSGAAVTPAGMLFRATILRSF